MLDFFELARLDDVLAPLLLERVREQLPLAAEVRRQERLDKSNVVMDPADLEDFFPPQAEFLVPVAPDGLVDLLEIKSAVLIKGVVFSQDDRVHQIR